MLNDNESGRIVQGIIDQVTRIGYQKARVLHGLKDILFDLEIIKSSKLMLVDCNAGHMYTVLQALSPEYTTSERLILLHCLLRPWKERFSEDVSDTKDLPWENYSDLDEVLLGETTETRIRRQDLVKYCLRILNEALI